MKGTVAWIAMAIVVLGIANVLCPPVCLGSESAPWEVGVRSGFTFFNPGKNFEQVDLFLRRGLPLGWSIGDDCRLGVRGEGAVGVLFGNGGRKALLASAGPDLVLGLFRDRLKLHAGSRLALLSRYNYGYRNFGGPIQFINHLGISFRVTDALVIGYRFQHMSNADIYAHNPGLNINLLEFGLLF